MNLTPPENYRTPNLYSINKAVDKCGYNYYLPIGILKNLVCLCAHDTMNGDKNLAFNADCSPNNIIEFYRSINLNNYRIVSPLDRSLAILKDLSKEIDFIELESGGDNFINPESTNNFLEKVSTEDINMFESLGIDDMDSIAEVMKIVNKIKSKINNSSNRSEETIFERIKNYTDLFKLKSSELVRPDFKYKLINKSFNVENNSMEEENEVIIYLEDASSSMLSSRCLAISSAIRFMLLNTDNPVHYYRYAGQAITFKDLQSKEDKLKEFSEIGEYHTADCDYEGIFKILSSKYKSGQVIMLTDGDDYIPKVNTGSIVFNIISTINSNDLTSLAKKSGGKILLI